MQRFTPFSLFRYFSLSFIGGVLALQLGFILQIALLTTFKPISTSFITNEYVRLCRDSHDCSVKRTWINYDEMGISIKKAVVASEDANFVEHKGVEVDSLLKAWERNNKKGKFIAGGSTITQQLAKNLYLSSEKNYLRKAQELALTAYIEMFLDKQRIFEIYLNVVEWGEGIFGIQEASKYYYGKDANQISNYQAARLASALPAPKCFDDDIYCGNININFKKKAGIIAKRMGVADIPADDGLGKYIQKNRRKFKPNVAKKNLDEV
ncbi:MAG: monofunctional biosynthetic peptidoglycan transglycosylase [Pseudomonadota bacterium]|jgi:monofunctional biosynthetic peptidoglycan transglycosylase